MKALKILSVIGLALIVFGASAITPEMLNSRKQSVDPGGNIKYKVVIHANPTLAYTINKFFVVMTDETGRLIGEPQHVTYGLMNYFFSETGPVSGTRIVRIIQPSVGGPILPFYCDPDSKTGTFRNGVIYQFNLYPQAGPTE